MDHLKAWLIGVAVILIGLPLAAWAGLAYGRKAARDYPGLAMALWVMMAFFKLDPPPPPKAERVTRDEENKGAPPTT